MSDSIQNDSNGTAVTNTDSPMVVISFKTLPINKIRWSQECLNRGLTLSEWINSVVSSFARSAEQNQTLDDALAKLALYENDELLAIFEQVKGQTVSFTTAKGRPMTVKIEAPEDVYAVIINSFKIDKK